MAAAHERVDKHVSVNADGGESDAGRICLAFYFFLEWRLEKERIVKTSRTYRGNNHKGITE